MTDDPNKIAEMRSLDSAKLRALRHQFDCACDALLKELCTINEYLAAGAPKDKTDIVRMALTLAPDRMNECRFLLAHIEAITRDAEREEPRGT